MSQMISTKRAVSVSLQSGLPTLIWGPPGTGKTSFFNALANVTRVPFESIIASIREPSDFGGLPVIREDGVVLEAPAWAKRLAQSEEGLLFIDEISTAPPAVQAALLRVTHEGVVGDISLPTGVWRGAAANPPEQAAGGWVLSPPLANRFVHFDWPTDALAWADGMVSGWEDQDKEIIVLPDSWEEGVPGKRALVSSYVRTRPNKLINIPKNENEAGKAWASPRTWDYSARLLAACEASTATEEEQIYVLAGALGNAEAGEFLVWVNELDLQDPEELLADPKSYKHPNRNDKVFAVLSSLITAALGNLTKGRWIAAWQVLARAADKGSPDIAAFAARALGKKITPDLPIPSKELVYFTPILQEAKLI